MIQWNGGATALAGSGIAGPTERQRFGLKALSRHRGHELGVARRRYPRGRTRSISPSTSSVSLRFSMSRTNWKKLISGPAVAVKARLLRASRRSTVAPTRHAGAWIQAREMIKITGRRLGRNDAALSNRTDAMRCAPSGRMLVGKSLREWRNWQTRRI
jgi:hypothetical protein